MAEDLIRGSYDAIEIVIEDMKIVIGKDPLHKLPNCKVGFDDETHYTTVAVFKDDDTAKWFAECLIERLERKWQNG